MRMLDIALKDLRQLVFDWRTALFLLLMPIGFTLLFAFVFAGGDGAEDARLPVGYIDLDDGGTLSSHLLALLESSESIRPVVLDDADLEGAQAQVAEDELAAVLVVPAGYTAQTLSDSGDATTGPLLIADLNSNAGQAAQSGLQVAQMRLLSAVEAANLTTQAYTATGGNVDDTLWTESLDRAIGAWDDPPLTVALSASGSLPDEEETASPTDDYAHSSAGIMVQFAMAGLIGAAEIIVIERKSGTMRRLLTTPVGRIEIILGHFLAMLIMILAQLAVLILFGQLLLGVGYLREPLGTLLMLLTTAFWAASLGLLIGIFARTEEQIVIYTIGIMLVLSGLGGAWMPLEFTSKAFQTVGHLMPTAWAIDGFENIVVRGLGISSVLQPAAILLGFAVVFFAVAIWRFRFE